tara:strand:- start:612 stop:797 length:186 start_codon:yes stop_codon:yes gene_type:complete
MNQVIIDQKLSELEADLFKWVAQRNDTVNQYGKKYAETQICYIQNEISRLATADTGISWEV